jgi:hypothetical protein
MRGCNERIVLDTLNINFNSKTEAVKGGRVAERDLGVDLRTFSCCLLTVARSDELKGTKEACCDKNR